MSRVPPTHRAPTHRRRGSLLRWAGFCLATGLLHLAATEARAQPESTTCVVGAHVFTGTPGVDATTVCFTGERIVSLDGAPPADATVVEGRGLVLTPGFVAVGAAVGLLEVNAVPESVQVDAGGDDPVRAAFRVADGYDPFSDLVALARSGGITSAVLLPSGGLVSGTGAWVDLRSHDHPVEVVDGPVVLQMDARAAQTSGGARGGLLLFYRELLDDARTWARNPRAFDLTRLREISAGRLDLEVLAQALDGSRGVLVHASSVVDLRAALRLGDEFGFAPAVAGAQDAWAIASELAERGTPALIHPLENLPRGFDRLGAREDAAARLDAAGVPVVLVPGETHNARNLRFVAGNAVRAGLPWESALASITSRPAAWMGLGDEVGTVEPGRLANLVLWTGDPFEPSTQVVQVWVRGEATSFETRADALYERHASPRPPRAPAPTAADDAAGTAP